MRTNRGLIHNTWVCGFGKEIFMHHNEVVTGMWSDSYSMEWKHWAWASLTDLIVYLSLLWESLRGKNIRPYAVTYRRPGLVVTSAI